MIYVTKDEDGRLGMSVSEDAVKGSHELFSLIGIVKLIDLEKVEQLSLELGRHETLAPMFDPTGFMQHGERVRKVKQVADAFIAFREKIDLEGL